MYEDMYTIYLYLPCHLTPVIAARAERFLERFNKTPVLTSPEAVDLAAAAATREAIV